MSTSKYFMRIFRKPVSLSITIYRSFFSSSGYSRANRATKTSSISPQTSVTGRFGPICHVVSVPTIVSAFSRRPFTRTHQTLLFGIFSKLFIPFSIFDKVYILLGYLLHPPPTYIPPTDLQPSTHPATYLSTHPSTYLPTYGTYLPPTYPLINSFTYLPNYLPPPTHGHLHLLTHLLTSIHPPSITNLPTHPSPYLSTFLHPPTH